MKNIKLLAILFISSIIVTSCSDDDPDHIHEEEEITTMKVVLTPSAGTKGADVVTLEWKNIEDHDEEGHEEGEHEEEPEITGGTLMANATYNAVITLLNENESPAEDITLEVKEEAEDHQFFYTASGIASTFTYSDSDADGKPIGVEFTVTTGAVGTGSYTIILKHEPTKSDTNDMTNVGGETDIEATFPITIEGMVP